MPLQGGHPAGRLRSAWRWYKERRPAVRIAIPFGLGFASVAGAWTVLNEGEYAVALGLIILFLLFGIQATRETAWSSTAKWVVSFVLTVITLYSSAVILKKGEGKPWSNLLADEEEAVRVPQPTISPSPIPAPTQRPSPSPGPSQTPSPTPSPSPMPSSSATPEPQTPEPAPTPDLWELQYNSRKSLFGMPDKTLQYYPPDYGVPVAIRCRLEYRPNKPWATSLIVYIPDTPFGMRSKEVLSSARFVMDNYNDIVSSIVADAGSDKANEVFLRGRVIKADRVVFYHTPRISPDDVTVLAHLGVKASVNVERYGPRTVARN